MGIKSGWSLATLECTWISKGAPPLVVNAGKPQLKTHNLVENASFFGIQNCHLNNLFRGYEVYVVASYDDTHLQVILFNIKQHLSQQVNYPLVLWYIKIATFPSFMSQLYVGCIVPGIQWFGWQYFLLRTHPMISVLWPDAGSSCAIITRYMCVRFKSKLVVHMMTSSNGNIFRVTGLLLGEFTGHRWIPLTKASVAELWCSLWSTPETNGWVNNRNACDLSRHRAHFDVIVMRALFADRT